MGLTGGVALGWMLLPLAVWGQNGRSGPAAAVTPHTVQGRVVNGINQTPVARALVNLNGRTLLTDSQGKFSFAEFADQQGYLTAGKPGFGELGSPDTMRIPLPADPAASVELTLFPDALVTGSVTRPDGEAAVRVPVVLQRLLYGGGNAAWTPRGFAQTDAHGEFRFSVPAGRYRLATGYLPRLSDSPSSLLPTTLPALGSSAGSQYMEIHSGETVRQDLHPRGGQAVAVRLRTDRPMQNGQVTAMMLSGEVFQVPCSATGVPDELRMEIPKGSYLIRVKAENPDAALDGSAQVTVGSAEQVVTVHLAPFTSLPIEALSESGVPVQSSSGRNTVAAPRSSGATFNLRQMNLLLEAQGEAAGPQNNVNMRPGRDGSFDFRVAAGRYRLRQNGEAAWHVKAATCGGTDLLTDELVIGPGAAGMPIRLVVENGVGKMHGTVRMPDGVGRAYVYLLPVEPSLQAFREVFVQPSGAFSAQVPVGKYVAVAVQTRPEEDFHDAHFVAGFAAGGHPVEVSADGDVGVDLTLAQTGERP